MDYNKICFITCVKNEQHATSLNESIKTLEIPKGVQIETRYVMDAPSRAEAYNAAMKTSDASIKIYLYDNIAITDTHLLYKIINIFSLADDIGVIGLVGATRLSVDGIIRHGIMQNIGVLGKIYETDIAETNIQEITFGNIQGLISEVDAVEGFFMATNRDITWREDIFKGFYYTETAQCLEFKKQNYKIVVANQDQPWCVCVNDDKHLDEVDMINSKKVFMEEYKDYFPGVSIMIPTYNRPFFIQKAIDSIINQTYKNIEIVIADNSEDDCVEKAIREKYLNKYSNIQYVRNNRNLGLLGNCQQVNKMASNDIRLLLCDDDYLALHAIEKQVNYLWLDINQTISITTQDSGVYKLFDHDFILDGRTAIELMASYNMTLFGFSCLYRSHTITEPFGTLGGRQATCNMDRYIGYLALTAGNGVYIHDKFYFSIDHEEHASGTPLLIIDGGNDYAHEILTMRKYGYLSDDVKFEKALDTAEWYFNNFALGEKVPLKLDIKERSALQDTLEYMKKIHNSRVELYKNKIINKHGIQVKIN